MAVLFDKERSVITKHIRNAINEGEVDERQVCANFAHTAPDGKTYQVAFYNLDVIISVGYPPDLQEEAVKTVLAQAELVCADWEG